MCLYKVPIQLCITISDVAVLVYFAIKFVLQTGFMFTLFHIFRGIYWEEWGTSDRGVLQVGLDVQQVDSAGEIVTWAISPRKDRKILAGGGGKKSREYIVYL